MIKLPKNCIDLTVTSPPYDDLRCYDGYEFDFEAIAKQLWRITKIGGVLVWVVSDKTENGSETGTSFRQALYFKELGFNLHDTMIYEVAGTGAKGSNLAYWQAFEFMFVFSKGKPKMINLIRDRRNKKPGNVCGHRLRPNQDGSLRKAELYQTPEFSIRTNIWRYHAGKNSDDSTDHPAVFPERLARDHIVSWSNAGDIVFDPMVGSGTTTKMAVETGRNFLAFDISQQYVDDALQRTFQAQPPLFALDTPEQLAMEGI